MLEGSPHTAAGASEPKQRAYFVSPTLCTEIFKSSKFMRQLLPSVPHRSVLPSWLNIRPTSQQISMRSIKIDYSPHFVLQISISPEWHKQHSSFAHTCTQTHREAHAKCRNCRVKISISMREERKGGNIYTRLP